jgi:hypothetical protein
MKIRRSLTRQIRYALRKRCLSLRGAVILQEVFYLDSFKRERGQLTGRLAEWDPEPLEIAEEAVGSPEGEPPPF